MNSTPETNRPASSLDRLFSPRAIAVVGASDNPRSAGGQPMQFLTRYGYCGRIYPVNPKRDTVCGLRCHASVSDIPEPVDVALIAVAAPLVADVVRACGASGVGFAVILSSGFRERGHEGQAREAELAQVARASGVRIVGPNCMGVLNIPGRVHSGFGQGFQVSDYLPGPVAMTTQSGGYGFTLLRNANRAGIGFNYVVSVGNSIDLDALDFIDHFLDCTDVRIVTAFVEGVSDGRRLIELGRKALAVNKPVLIWKVGNTEAGAKAAASHTASMSSRYALFQAAFRQGGYVEVRDYEDMVDITKAFLGGMLPGGDRVALVSGSGGAGVIAADRFTEAGLRLPEYTAQTQARLRAIFPPLARPDNPIDLSGETTADGKSLSNAAARLVLADDNIDMIMLRSGQTTGSLDATQELIEIRRQIGKPVLVATVAEDHQPAKDLLDKAGVPWFLTVGRAASAARALADFAARKRRAGMPDDAVRPVDRQHLALPATPGRFLSEAAALDLLAAYGLPVVRRQHVPADAIDRMDLGADLAFPLAVKVCSPDLPHKSEAGGIRLGLTNPDDVKDAARQVLKSARAFAPDARLDGILVQEMATGTEFIFGALSDPCFGPVVMFGPGGVLAEVMHDVAYGFAPLGARAARDMLTGIRAGKLLQGYRGAPPADMAVLADFAMRLGCLIADHGDRIESIDINPVFVHAARVVAADALVVLKDRGCDAD